MHLNFTFKWARTLAIKILTVVQSYFKLQLLWQHYESMIQSF